MSARVSSMGLRSLGLIPWLITRDSRGWRHGLFSLFIFLFVSLASAVALHRSDVYSAEVLSDLALIVLAGFVPIAFGMRTGTRMHAVCASPALAALPGLRRRTTASTVATALALGLLAAASAALAAPTVKAFGPLAAGGTSITLFYIAYRVGRWNPRSQSLSPANGESFGHGFTVDSARQARPRTNATKGAPSLDGPARLRAASRYALASDPRWSRSRALKNAVIIVLAATISTTVMNVVLAGDGNLIARLESLLFAPFGGPQSPGQIRGAGRDLLVILAFVPLFALTQHGPFGHQPFSRNTIANLCAKRFCGFGLTIFGVAVLVGSVLVGAVTWTSGAPVTERLVPYLVSALLILATLPALAAVALMGATMKIVTRSNRTKSLSLRQLAAASVQINIGFLVVHACVYFGLEMREGSYTPLPVGAVAAAVFVIASCMLPRLFRRHYASVSLVP